MLGLLNACGSAQSDLWSDGLGTFFLDDPFTLDFLVAIPSAAEGEALALAAMDPAKLRAIHTDRYSLASYPFSTRYQNSNQWALEAIASASQGEPWSRARAQSWLASQGYEPAELRIGPLERLGGRMFKANVAFDDHPNELRFSDRIRVASADSIANFLARRGWRVMEFKGPQLAR